MKPNDFESRKIMSKISKIFNDHNSRQGVVFSKEIYYTVCPPEGHQGVWICCNGAFLKMRPDEYVFID